ncbi:hypothetical protein [Burkholderia alba]|uniref:hypothetical protein n=1 Tax=Burkholderia alba TaxID=2683677 RepID=UPI002B052530|nr:hypothetical protein [Burkholderia alba]
MGAFAYPACGIGHPPFDPVPVFGSTPGTSRRLHDSVGDAAKAAWRAAGILPFPHRRNRADPALHPRRNSNGFCPIRRSVPAGNFKQCIGHFKTVRFIFSQFIKNH